jgi:hypothetical protein
VHPVGRRERVIGRAASHCSPEVTGLFLYCSQDAALRRHQLLARQALSEIPGGRVQASAFPRITSGVRRDRSAFAVLRRDRSGFKLPGSSLLEAVEAARHRP